MPDWKEINFDEIASDTAAETDDELAGKISSLTKMTDEDVKKLFPKVADAQKLKKLMEIVHSADRQNVKVKNLMNNIEELSGVIITLVKKFV